MQPLPVAIVGILPTCEKAVYRKHLGNPAVNMCKGPFFPVRRRVLTMTSEQTLRPAKQHRWNEFWHVANAQTVVATWQHFWNYLAMKRNLLIQGARKFRYPKTIRSSAFIGCSNSNLKKLGANAQVETMEWYLEAYIVNIPIPAFMWERFFLANLYLNFWDDLVRTVYLILLCLQYHLVI